MIAQIRIGEAISFWETCFDSLGKQKPKNVGHSTMLSCFGCWHHHFSFTLTLSGFRTSSVWKPFTFLVVTSLCSGWEIVFGDYQWLSFLPTFCCIFLHCFQVEIVFLEMPSEWERRPTILGVIEPVFGHGRAKTSLEIVLLLKGHFYPFWKSFLLPETAFHPTRNRIVFWCIFWLWPALNWEWKWGWALLDKPSVCRSLTDRAWVDDFLLCTPE